MLMFRLSNLAFNWSRVNLTHVWSPVFCLNIAQCQSPCVLIVNIGYYERQIIFCFCSRRARHIFTLSLWVISSLSLFVITWSWIAKIAFVSDLIQATYNKNSGFRSETFNPTKFTTAPNYETLHPKHAPYYYVFSSLIFGGKKFSMCGTCNSGLARCWD